MAPFGVRLIRGAYSESGELLLTFRALEDGTLTDAADEAIAIPDPAGIGVVHPAARSA